MLKRIDAADSLKKPPEPVSTTLRHRVSQPVLELLNLTFAERPFFDGASLNHSDLSSIWEREHDLRPIVGTNLGIRLNDRSTAALLQCRREQSHRYRIT